MLNQKFNRGLKFILQKYLLMLLMLLFLTANLSAQEKAKIYGKVVDSETGEPLIGANVVIKGTTMGAAADIEGNYTIKSVPRGSYDLVFSVISYTKKTVTDVEVKAGSSNKVDVSLTPESIQTEEVVITAKALEDTEAGLLINRQKSSSVSDAISAEQISRSGSGDAADATKQIVGASVVEGKHVYVRGLGDRYSSTQLNGAEIPSVDPYKRAGSIDLIPTSLVDNIQAIKSFTPDKQGNFSGGAVNIKTKNFPQKLSVNFSASSSYNTNSSFNQKFLDPYASSTDWLGMDDGGSDIPDVIGSDIWSPDITKATNDQEVAREIEEKTKAFGSDYSLKREQQPLNRSYGFSVGNQVSLFGRPLGFFGSLKYKRNTSGYTDGQLNRWDRGVADPDKEQLDVAMNLKDQSTKDEVLWGIVLKSSLKLSPEHVLSFDGLINQNGENRSRILSGSYPYDTDPENTWTSITHQYKERSLRSFQLSGMHFFKDILNAKLDWKASYLTSKQDVPDLRYVYDITTPSGIHFSKSNLEPERFFRYTDEIQREYQADISVPFKLLSEKNSTFKFGGYYSKRDRNFNERRFIYEDFEKHVNSANGDLDRLFSDEYIGQIGQDTISFGGYTTIQNKMGIYIVETNQKSSNYVGDREISAGYAMFDLPIMSSLRVIGGARLENTIMKTVSETDSVGSIDTHDILPSLSLIYNITSDMNFRMSYGRTLARPTFREVAPFLNYEFNGGDTYVGNTELKRTLVDNYDIRWEWFYGPGEILAVSAFAKNFYNPIQLKIQNAVNQVLTWTNVSNASIRGLEFEARGSLGIISDHLSNFRLGGNLTLIDSEVDINKDELKNIREYDPDAKSTRPFQGQSPYILNLYLNYDNFDHGWSGTIYYNVFGRRLAAIGSVGAPDMYEEPFNLLNVSVSKKLFNHITIEFSANNLLNDNKKKTQNFKGTEYIYTQYTEGITYSMGLKYEL